jgi:hypothetical protein
MKEWAYPFQARLEWLENVRQQQFPERLLPSQEKQPAAQVEA